MRPLPTPTPTLPPPPLSHALARLCLRFRELPFSPIVTIKGMKRRAGRVKTPYIKGRGEAIVEKAANPFFALPPDVGRKSGPGTLATPAIARAPARHAPARAAPAGPGAVLFLPATPGKMATKRLTWDDTQKATQRAKRLQARQEREERKTGASVASPTAGASPAPAASPPPPGATDDAGSLQMRLPDFNGTPARGTGTLSDSPGGQASSGLPEASP